MVSAIRFVLGRMPLTEQASWKISLWYICAVCDEPTDSTVRALNLWKISSSDLPNA